MLEKYTKDFLTPDEVAYELNVTPTTVYNLLRKGEIPASKIGKNWRIPKSRLKKMLNTPSVTKPSKRSTKKADKSVSMDEVMNAFIGG